MRSVLEYHPVIGYRFIPSIKARILHESGGYLIRCNNLGFRCNRDIQIGAKSKKQRVLIFGDSYTAGEGVCNEVRYSDLLESMFKDVDIYNFGLPGTGTDQQYLTYKTYAENLQPDLVIISVMVENIRCWNNHQRRNKKACITPTLHLQNLNPVDPLNLIF